MPPLVHRRDARRLESGNTRAHDDDALRSVELEQRAAAPVTAPATRHRSAAQAGGKGEAVSCGSGLLLSAWLWRLYPCARARLIWYGVAAELLPRMPTPLPTCGKKVGKNPPHNAADFRKYATLFVLSRPSIYPAHLYAE